MGMFDFEHPWSPEDRALLLDPTNGTVVRPLAWH
jgi:hypothetical protein